MEPPDVVPLPGDQEADGPTLPVLPGLEDEDLPPGIDALPDGMDEGPILGMPEEEELIDGTPPFQPGLQRLISIVPRDGPQNYRIWTLPKTDDGTLTTMVSGGVQIVVEDPKFGTVDIVADRAVIWTKPAAGGNGARAVSGGTSVQSPDQPLEVYLEGDVRVLLDKRETAGVEDQSDYEAQRFYADLRMERYLALDAELKQYSQGFIAPVRTLADSIFQYREYQRAPNGSILLDESGSPLLSLSRIQAERATITGSQFANPGYRFNASSVELTELPPNSQRKGLLRRLFNPTSDNNNEKLYLIDSRQNTYFLGPVPYFYWPRFLTTSEDLNPPLQQLSFRTNNLFGQMVLSDWDGFKLLGLKKPRGFDAWNIDLDYLSDRGFALGTEVGYSGQDFSTDLFGRDLLPGVAGSYFGYLDAWGLRDHGVDNLGAGPAIVTNYPPGAPIRVYQRGSVPPFQDWRGRALFRHMQSLLPQDADPYEDFRIQFETALESDRHFLEQYFNRVFSTGLDQANRVYGIRQWENRALSLWVEGNQQSWYTDSQWLPKLDYYRLGGAPLNLDRYIQYFHHSGVDYANVHTAAEVNNTQVFNFLPYDPTSLTSGVFSSGRMYTNHEIQVPLNFEFIRITPYAQGQLVGWDSQYETPLPAFGFVPGLPTQAYIRGRPGSTLGRAWGAYGGRADIIASRLFPGVESELMNVHGLNHKVNFYVDYRNAFSDQSLTRIGIQDDLDENTYELVRRYTSMLYYKNGVLPAQYSPVLLTLRRNISPITGTVDVQDSIETVRLGVTQRLQTKRGPIDKRHIIDYMTLDIYGTYFPQATRDNFGKSWGQAAYNYEWFIGDRTSIVSTGWFDFFDIVGDSNVPRNRDGLQVIMTGVNLTRIPRSMLTIGYSIINTGPINSSALTVNGGYWLSPKWYATAGGLYDFGEGLLLSTFFSLTRIGSDFLTSVGLNVNPLQNNFGFSFELVPRFSPNTRIGSGGGAAFRPDIRYLPQQ